MSDRNIRVIGIPRGPWQPGSFHTDGCKCDTCAPAFLVMLTDYESRHLLDALERRDGADTGDWHSQIRQKLASALTEQS